MIKARFFDMGFPAVVREPRIHRQRSTRSASITYADPHVGDLSFLMHYGDMTDSTNLICLMQQIRPDEIYNLAAQSHIAVSIRLWRSAPLIERFI